jgi:hypothetical protein
MLKFRATSTRVTDGHGASNFSNSEEIARTWAKNEMEGGHDAVVYEVKEVLVAEYPILRCEVPGCRKKLERGATRCTGCGRPAPEVKPNV